jgi:hypothetical protein
MIFLYSTMRCTWRNTRQTSEVEEAKNVATTVKPRECMDTGAFKALF